MDQPFLRIPPFPGHRSPPLASAGSSDPLDLSTAADLVDLLRKARVGGSFWAAQPNWPAGHDVLLAPCTPSQALEMLKAARVEGVLKRCVMLVPKGGSFEKLGQHVPVLAGPVDPWHIAEAAGQVWAGADHELTLVGALAKRPIRCFGQGRFSECANDEEGLVRTVQRDLGGWTYRCPFAGNSITPIRAGEILSEWRKLVDSNRTVAAAFGVAPWKRPTVGPLLWDGSAGPRYARQIPDSREPRSQVVAWKSRTPSGLLGDLDRSTLQLIEMEDGMIRGRGLGANCIPPLSVVLDNRGIYFDPSQPSDLEQILESADIDDELIARAARLRHRIVEEAISKYDSGAAPKGRSVGKRKILVVGQVDDDRSILSGGGGQTNLELLQRARSIEPEAWLIYRPHPDIESGHRKGHIADKVALGHADEIDRGGSIISLIEAVDEVHCITSLAGFEALLRGTPVTTHGVPFYAGWGLTRDLGSIPSRRTRRRSLDELVAATLILYPRYVDPVTRLPCSPEILVERIARGEDSIAAPLASMRQLQGKLKVAVRRLREMAA